MDNAVSKFFLFLRGFHFPFHLCSFGFWIHHLNDFESFLKMLAGGHRRSFGRRTKQAAADAAAVVAAETFSISGLLEAGCLLVSKPNFLLFEICTEI